MNKVTKYGIGIIVALYVSLIYNAQLTFAIFLANIVADLIITDNMIRNFGEEEFMKMFPQSFEDICELFLLSVLKGSINTCLIVIFFHIIQTIYG